MYTWRVVVSRPNWHMSSRIVRADSQVTACEKVARLYRIFAHRDVHIHDAYRVPECIEREIAAICAARAREAWEPMSLARAIEATLAGLDALERLYSMRRDALANEQRYAQLTACGTDVTSQYTR